MHRILIIDDDHELCELLHDYLSVEGLEIVSVHAGDTGAQAALEQEIDLVILDVMLPGMNADNLQSFNAQVIVQQFA